MTMRLTSISILVVLLLSLPARAAGLYGLAFVSGELTVVSIDPTSGAITPVVATGAANFAIGTSAFDSANNRYFFASDSNLYVVNVASHTVSHAPTGAGLFEFDDSTGTLYGLADVSGQLHVVSIDPSSGAITPVVATDATSVGFGISTFDSVTHRYFFLGNSELYIVNVASHTVAHVPTSAGLFEFDDSTGTLYGLADISGQLHVVSIDPSSGAITSVVAIGATSVVAGYSTFDSTNHRYFFSSNGDLYVVNVANHTVSHVPISAGQYEFDQSGATAPTLSGIMLLSLFLCLTLIALFRLTKI